MPIAGTLLKRRQTGMGLVALVQLTLSGTYPGSGDPFDFTTVVGFTTRRPDFVVVTGIAGFVYLWDTASEKLWVYCNTAGGANAALGDHTNATYAAGVSGDTIIAMAFWLAVPQLPSA